MGDSLEALCGFNPRRPLVLDGGFGQLIADKYPHLDIPDGLWASGVAARFPDVIRHVHLMYLRVGAEIIPTAIYQASVNGYISAGLADDKAGAKRLIEWTLLLAVEA
ncbi:hypothetical protein LPJ66_004993 [Kickxella alabastrina]|uniref:Uncharacterized protein n=1 Tax=Kickxella alabastrina TaxID=61397 RepID=A0ACC1IGG4_9FUNG|nr:hypothetical protein LPJ66_004993 [Kickxella alabastrina]